MILREGSFDLLLDAADLFMLVRGLGADTLCDLLVLGLSAPGLFFFDPAFCLVDLTVEGILELRDPLGDGSLDLFVHGLLLCGDLLLESLSRLCLLGRRLL